MSYHKWVAEVIHLLGDDWQDAKQTIGSPLGKVLHAWHEWPFSPNRVAGKLQGNVDRRRRIGTL